MSRRVSRSLSALFAITLLLSAPAAFAARRAPTFDDPAGPVERIVRTVKKFMRGLAPKTNNFDVPSAQPRPPIP